jgi:hypothetical protein
MSGGKEKGVGVMEIKGVGDSFQKGLTCTSKIKENSSFQSLLDAKLSDAKDVASCAPSVSRRDLLEQGETMLTLLDRFARDLGNAGRTLKEMEPLVKAIEKELGRLQSSAERVDGGLKGFLNHLAVTGEVAVLKYHRGDFV